MRPRVLLSIVVLVGLLVTVMLLQRPRRPEPHVPVVEDDASAPRGEEGTSPSAGSSPSLVGSGVPAPAVEPPHEPAREVAESPLVPRENLFVHLRPTDGGEVEDGIVYLLPKTSGGENRLEHRRKADAVGRALFAGVDSAGHLIGGYAAGYLPAFADGDAWDGEEVALALQPGREVEIELDAERRALKSRGFVAASTPTPDAAWRYPGPGRLVRFEAKAFLRGKRTHRIRVPTERMVRVRPTVFGHYADPEEAVLPPEQDRVVFRLRPTCRIALRARDAGAGVSLDAHALVKVLDLSTGRAVVEKTPAALRSWMREFGLRPGAYSVLVEAPGYAPFLASRVRLTDPGTTREVEALLELDATAGQLVLHLELPEGESLEGKILHVEGRTGDATSGEARGWVRLPIREEDPARHTVTVGPLAHGDHEVFVWAGRDRVGRTEATIRGGAPDHAVVGVDVGLVVDLANWPDPGPGDATEVAGDLRYFVRLEDRAGSRLPTVRWQSRQPFGIGLGGPGIPADRVDRSPEVPGHGVLGPYPLEEIHVYGLAAAEAEPWIVRPSGR